MDSYFDFSKKYEPAAPPQAKAPAPLPSAPVVKNANSPTLEEINAVRAVSGDKPLPNNYIPGQPLGASAVSLSNKMGWGQPVKNDESFSSTEEPTTDEQNLKNLKNTPTTIKNLAVGAGKGVVKTAQESSDIIGRVSSLLPQSLKAQLILSHPALAGVLGLIKEISPAVSKLEENVGAEKGAATAASNTDEEVGSALSQIAMAINPVGESAGAVNKAVIQPLIEKSLTKTGGDSLKIAVEAITPKLKGKNLVAHYLQDFGAEAQQGGVFTAQKAKPTKQIEEIASRLEGALQSKSPLKNLQTLGEEMRKTESKLKDILLSDKTPVIKQEMAEELDLVRSQIPEEFQAIKENKNLFNRVISYAQKTINNTIKESSGVVNDLREARIKFDYQAKKEFPSAFKNGRIDVSTPAGRAIKATRDAMNAHLYRVTPNGSELQSLIQRESDIFNAAQNIAPQVAENEGKTLMSQFFSQIKEHPVVSAGVTAGVVAGSVNKFGH